MTTIEALTYSPTDTPQRRQDHPIPSQFNNDGIRELRAGVRAWENKPKKQIGEEVASLCMETKRIPDPYFYKIDHNGKLISPVTGRLVEEVVLRDSEVGELEFQALRRIQEWDKDKKSGVIAWLSAPKKGFYDVSKVIVSEIREQGGEQILFNRAIVLDIDEDRCFKLAKSLSNYSLNKPHFSSNDEVRAIPLELNTNCHWTYILEELLPDISLEQVRKGEDLIIKDQTVNRALNIYKQAISEMGRIDVERFVNIAERSGIVGERGSSCPPKNKTAFGLFAENAKEVGEKCEKVRCRRCGWEPTPGDEKRMESGELTSCPGKIKGEDGTEKICGWAPGQPV